jgi:ABC-type polysaccharide/polyol phosphate export permease
MRRLPLANSDLVYSYDAAKRRPAAIEELRELIRYRNLVVLMVRRDVVTRYKRSILGVAWTMLNPLGIMLVTSIVFETLWKQGPGFPVYVLSGLTMWTFFSLSSSDAMTNLISGVVLRQRVYMPSTIFALTAVGNGLVNMVLSFIPLFVVMLFTQVPLTWALFFLPVPMLIAACFTLGVGLLLSTLAVYFRDITAMYSIILTAWMYLNPIVYPVTMLSDQLRFWDSLLNPLWTIIDLFRTPVLYGTIPPFTEIWPVALISIVILFVGWIIFTRKADEFAYRI